MDIVPKAGTMEKLHNPDLKFSFGSLYHQEYQRDFDEAICRAVGLDTSDDMVTDIQVANVQRTNVRLTDDSDWYII